MTYKYCQNCGKSIPAKAKFCPYCDTRQMIKSVPKAKVSSRGHLRVQVNGNQISLTHHHPTSFNMKIITLITVMMDVIVMILFGESWESIAINVKAVGSMPIIIYILFTLWTAFVEYFFGEKMSKLYNVLMLSLFGLMGLVAFVFLVAGTMIF